jgi:hypothetical protein
MLTFLCCFSQAGSRSPSRSHSSSCSLEAMMIYFTLVQIGSALPHSTLQNCRDIKNRWFTDKAEIFLKTNYEKSVKLQRSPPTGSSRAALSRVFTHTPKAAAFITDDDSILLLKYLLRGWASFLASFYW